MDGTVFLSFVLPLSFSLSYFISLFLTLSGLRNAHCLVCHESNIPDIWDSSKAFDMVPFSSFIDPCTKVFIFHIIRANTFRLFHTHNIQNLIEWMLELNFPSKSSNLNINMNLGLFTSNTNPNASFNVLFGSLIKRVIEIPSLVPFHCYSNTLHSPGLVIN